MERERVIQVASRISDGTVQDRSRPRTLCQRCGRRVCLVSSWWNCRHSRIGKGWWKRWQTGKGRLVKEYYTAAQVSVLSMSLAMRYTLCRQVKLALSCQQHVCATRWASVCVRCVPSWNEDKCFNVKLQCSKHNGNRAAASDWRELERLPAMHIYLYIIQWHNGIILVHIYTHIIISGGLRRYTEQWLSFFPLILLH